MNPIMKITYPLFILFLTVSCKSTKDNMEVNKQDINQTIDAWHKAASNAQLDDYFSLMTSDGVFIGTDATENWQNEAFKTFSKPYFDKGKAWNFSSLQRNIYFNKNQDTAWFDELLDTQMKICRGSGVMIKVGNEWKIAHYVLSMTIPNELTSEITKLKDKIESEEILKLKAK
jgi:ketosteroid isomerase-like protein